MLGHRIRRNLRRFSPKLVILWAFSFTTFCALAFLLDYGWAAGAGLASPAFAPDQPTGLSGVAGDGKATLTWDDPNDANITGYQYLQVVEAELTASDGAAGDYFGISVAVDGGTMIVGAYRDAGAETSSGSAYVFTKESGAWVQAARLTASDGATDDQFGISVAVDGEAIVVGAHFDDDAGSNSGSAYVFVKPSDGWATATETAKLTASDATASDVFGGWVAAGGDTIVVGAIGDSDAGSASGSAYVFVKPADGWATATETAKLTASDAAAGYSFGRSVAVGDTIVVGSDGDDDAGSASGSAYVFVKPADGWATATETAKLTASDAAEFDQFGWSVAVDGDTIVVGADGDDDAGSSSGSAYVFVKPDTGWATTKETAKLTTSDGAAGDQFGGSVAVDGDTIVVGAPLDDDAGANSGSAYVFVKPADGWATATETARLTASDAAAGDQFGGSVAVDGNTIAAGAFLDHDVGTDAGSAYTFSHVRG